MVVLCLRLVSSCCGCCFCTWASTLSTAEASASSQSAHLTFDPRMEQPCPDGAQATLTVAVLLEAIHGSVLHGPKSASGSSNPTPLLSALEQSETIAAAGSAASTELIEVAETAETH